MKHGNVSNIVGAHFATSGPEQLAVIDGFFFLLYLQILKENVRSSVCELNLKRTCVMQQYSDSQSISHSTREQFKKSKMLEMANSTC